MAEQKRTRFKERFKTYGNVFDEFTHRNLFKLASQGIIEELKSSISIGKEANIFTASTKEEGIVILKIFRLETCDFNRMYNYIKFDTRYPNLKQGKREVIFTWTQREFRNLVKARDAGVRVPMPLKCLHNIVVLESIGEDIPAPKIKDVLPENDETKKKMFEKIINYMKKLHDSGLVHGDLSEFNILNLNDKPVFIDFSQSTTTKSITADELLVRDIKNVCRFFRKNGVDYDETEVKKRITKNSEDLN